MDARVYRNLNTGLWSIKQKVNGKWVVVGHCRECVLIDATPKVSEKVHTRVRRDNTREVFAWLQGSLCAVEGFQAYQGREAALTPVTGAQATQGKVTFHPFDDIQRGFFWAKSGEDFTGSPVAFFSESQEVFCA